MAYDIYIIILTGFAVFGMYCFVDTVFSLIELRNMPASVLILKNDMSDKTFKKVKFTEQNIPNNYTVLYPYDETKEESEQLEILNGYIENVLGVKNVNNQ